MIGSQYVCDECGRKFSHPVWHCVCHKHHWFSVKRCPCGHKCHLPAEWMAEAETAAQNWQPAVAADDPDKPTLKDSEGRPVPERLLPVFRDTARELRSWVQAIGRVRSRLVEATKETVPGVEVLCASRQTALQLIAKLKSILNDSLPSEVHETCGGHGCVECRQRGWMPLREPSKAIRPLAYRQLTLWDRF